MSSQTSKSPLDRDKRLKAQILKTARINDEDIARAEDYALTMNMALDESIAFLQLMDYQSLGKVLEEIYHLPYESLLDNSPPEPAKKAIPLNIAERLTVFPLDLDPRSQSITVAIDAPDDETKKEQLKHILPPATKIAFKVASRPEILKAIDIHYKGKSYAPQIQVRLPEKFTIVTHNKGDEISPACPEKITRKRIALIEPDVDRYRAIKTLLGLEGAEVAVWARDIDELLEENEPLNVDTILVNAEKYRTARAWPSKYHSDKKLPPIAFFYPRAMLMGQEYPYRAVSEAFISLVALVIKKALKKDPVKLQDTMTTVRYCKLLSLKLALSPAQIDAVVLAAWFSTTSLGKMLVQSITTPYALEEILSESLSYGENSRIESQVLCLIRRYQDIKKSSPEAVKDIAAIRRNMGPEYGTGRGRILLESFLHVIRDEGLLKGIGEPQASIIIVGQSGYSVTDLEFALQSQGYDVLVVSNEQEAIERINSSVPDLVLCYISQDSLRRIELCKAIRKRAETAFLPLFFLAPRQEEYLATDCLAAGADDFLLHPVEPEIIALKAQRAINARPQKRPRKGIQGSLEEMSAMDIIQSVATGDKNVKITLESNGRKGNIFIRAGQIVHAETNGLIGEEALFELMSFYNGEFQVVSCSYFPKRTIHGSTMSLLMEGARLVDESADVK